MFNKEFSSLKIQKLLLNNEKVQKEKIREILSSSNLNLEQVAKLLAAYDDLYLRKKIIKAAHRLRKRIWQEQLFLMPPLYISDGDPNGKGCLDYCRYCPWRHNNIPKNKLKRLSAEEVFSEAEYLFNMGYRDIELVAATDPKLLNSGETTKFIRAVKDAGVKNVGINFFPLRSHKEYQQILNAGCAFVIVWQETYDELAYKYMHPRGPKSNMEYRLNAHDRACRGGIKTVGVAFLGGLADWRFETLATVFHALYLRKEYGANIIFGMPRWKNGSAANSILHSYNDSVYEFIGAVYSLAIPESLPWFSTREKFSLSEKCVKGGGCLFTLDCSTEVGGYTRKSGFAQFPVYSHSYSEGVGRLRRLRFSVKNNLPW